MDSEQPRLHRPPPLQLLPDALQASADTVVLPHPSLMSRSSGGGGGGKGGSSFSSSSSSSLRAPAHYPSSYLTALAPPPALALSLLPRALSGALLKKKDKKKNSSSEMQLSLSESVGAALGSLLALSVAAAAGLAAALGDISLVSAPRRLVPRAEVLAGAQLLALAALAPPPHLAAELVGVARAVVSGKKDFAAADSAAAVENSLLHLLIFSSPASDDNTSRGVFPLKQAGGRGLANYFPLTRLAICGLQLWSLLFLWLPATVLFPAAARAAAAALDASFASAAGAAAARAEEAGGPLSHWRDGKPGSGAGEEVKKSPAKIPELAREYWRPPAGAGMRTVLLSARADAVARALVGMASINPHTANPVLARSCGPWATSPVDAPRGRGSAVGGFGGGGFGFGSVLRARGSSTSSSPPPPIFVTATATVKTDAAAAKGAVRAPAPSSSSSSSSSSPRGAAATTTEAAGSPPQSQRTATPRSSSSSSPRAVAALMDALWSTVA